MVEYKMPRLTSIFTLIFAKFRAFFLGYWLISFVNSGRLCFTCGQIAQILNLVLQLSLEEANNRPINIQDSLILIIIDSEMKIKEQVEFLVINTMITLIFSEFDAPLNIKIQIKIKSMVTYTWTKILYKLLVNKTLRKGLRRKIEHERLAERRVVPILHSLRNMNSQNCPEQQTLF
ncbi:hypothetical protein BpHYR1_049606 [Brachionus plicatilis]|uniref:Uncharacterized protein n=1 Tax=Brachionus plicatilis TaxID=10195 RepID=A0A3M7P183_BRAPC|nr:hypothetical protein BpHYR1_049606 [Brachionus plicatilis]